VVTTPSESEVLVGYEGNPVDTGDITSADLSTLIDEAVSMFDNLFSDNVLFDNEVEDANTAVRYLARHKLAIALGDTVQSEAQSGGNVSYNVPSSAGRSLSRTTYGQEFLEYTRDTPNISVHKTR